MCDLVREIFWVKVLVTNFVGTKFLMLRQFHENSCYIYLIYLVLFYH